jgi:hypothetical protein
MAEPEPPVRTVEPAASMPPEPQPPELQPAEPAPAEASAPFVPTQVQRQRRQSALRPSNDVPAELTQARQLSRIRAAPTAASAPREETKRKRRRIDARLMGRVAILSEFYQRPVALRPPPRWP